MSKYSPIVGWPWHWVCWVATFGGNLVATWGNGITSVGNYCQAGNRRYDPRAALFLPACHSAYHPPPGSKDSCGSLVRGCNHLRRAWESLGSQRLHLSPSSKQLTGFADLSFPITRCGERTTISWSAEKNTKAERKLQQVPEEKCAKVKLFENFSGSGETCFLCEQEENCGRNETKMTQHIARSLFTMAISLLQTIQAASFAIHGKYLSNFIKT